MEAQISGTVNLIATPEPHPFIRHMSDEQKPKLPTLRESIAAVSEAARKLVASGLNQEAVVVLLYDRIRPNRRGKKLSKEDIRGIFKNLRELEKSYCG